MARRTRAREIPRLLEAGMPRGAIARALSVSKYGVRAVAEAAALAESAESTMRKVSTKT